MHKESGQDHRPDPARMAGREANFDDEIPWTEDDILRLHGLLLEKSLHDLFDLRVSAKTQADILDWMRAPRSAASSSTPLSASLHDLFDRRVSAATRLDILDWMQAPRTESSAFAYRACCRLFGLDDEEIRDRVLERYRRRHTH